MFSFVHVSSRNVGTEDVPNKVEVKTPLENLPSTTGEMDNSKPLYYEDVVDVSTGKNVDGTRKYEKLPFWVAMAIEGYKLHVNAKVSPKKTDGGLSRDDVMALIEKLPTDKDKFMAEAIFDNGTAKARKSLVERLKSL